ncbi:MAG: DUF3810 domain-containing protein [Ruminococcaceae bacterium]|nr:DUF3810 domain-containing protein [Oscillospiraceae bacterium]
MNLFKKIKKHITVIILTVFTVMCTAIYIVGTVSKDFAELFTTNIASIFRFFFGAISSAAPFSLAEVLIVAFFVSVLASVISFIVYLFKIVFGIKNRRFPVIVLVPFLVLVVVWDMFALTFSTSYNRYSLKEHLSLEDEIETVELFETLEWFVSEMNDSVKHVSFNSDGMSERDNSFSESAALINDAMNDLCEKYDFLQKKGFKAKPIMLSEPMTYTHISGVYTFFTGESNVNINYPDYISTFSTAHECSHQRGIAYENEANFLAFLTCLESDNEYIRYSGLVYMYTYISNAAYKTDKERYYALSVGLDPRIQGEYKAYSNFFQKYEDNIFEKTASAVNDTYLKSQGQEGVVTYSQVVTMLVNYYIDYIK